MNTLQLFILAAFLVGFCVGMLVDWMLIVPG